MCPQNEFAEQIFSIATDHIIGNLYIQNMTVPSR